MPEPPFLRENLEKQITLLVDLLKQKLNKQGEGCVNSFSKLCIKNIEKKRI